MGSWPKESCGGGELKKAGGSYRSRGVEGVLAERELRRGGGKQKKAGGGYRSRGVEGVLAESELRGGGGSKKKQQETIEVKVWKGSWSKGSCGGKQRGVVRGG